MDINQNAPLVGRKEMVIAAPLDTVWALVSELERWPDWQPDVKWIKLEGPLAPGSVFRWNSSGLNFTSTLQEVLPKRRIGWTGKTLGLNAVHNWTFEPIDDTHTRVTTEESIAGILSGIIKLLSANFMAESLESALQKLKTAAER